MPHSQCLHKGVPHAHFVRMRSSTVRVKLNTRMSGQIYAATTLLIDGFWAFSVHMDLCLKETLHVVMFQMLNQKQQTITLVWNLDESGHRGFGKVNPLAQLKKTLSSSLQLIINGVGWYRKATKTPARERSLSKNTAPCC